MKLLTLAFLTFPLLAQASTEPLLPQLPRPVFSANKIHVVYDQKAWAAAATLIRSAKRSIRMDFYIFGGPKADELANLLIQKHQAGLKVEIILDSKLGQLPAHTRSTVPTLKKLRDAGVPVILSSQVAFGSDASGAPHEGVPLDHDKYIVVDQKRALLGSTNFAPMFEKYHDLMMSVDGPVAYQLARLFDYDYYNALFPASMLPCPAKKTLSSSFPERIPSPTQRGLVRLISTGRCRETNYQALLQLLSQPHHSIYIQMHEMQDSEEIIGRLIAAKNRGADVRVIFDPSDWKYIVPGGSIIPRGTLNAEAIRKLQDAGIPVRYYPVSQTVTTAHMKSAVVDGEILFAGSMNWTDGGFHTVAETNFEILGGSAPAEALRQFQTDWEISTEASVPGTAARLGNWLSRKF